MKEVKVGGRVLALAFTLEAMDEMESAFGKAIDLEDVKETIVDGTSDRKNLVKCLYVMAKEGAALNGETLDIDEKWISRYMRPGDIPRMRIAIMETVADGMRMETAEGDEGEEVDLVLEELKKNQVADE